MLAAVVLGGCSTKKNTASTRGFHEMCTRYNVEFNAKNSYIEGQKIINDANKDDFTDLISIFPVSNSKGGAASQMDRTIEKCRKAIKKHSITKKPKRDSKKAKDPKYMYFYNQEEYVAGVKRAWILLGKAELHKGDFLGAASTFAYIQRHYPSDVEVVCEARIWQARAYAEMDWMYEALEVFDKVNENDVTKRLNNDYALTRAFLLLKGGEREKAIPFLQLAAERSRGRFYTSRYNYLLGQLQLEQGNKAQAASRFKLASKQAPAYPMVFNARLMMLQCESGNWQKNIKKLDRMLRSPNNKEYLDQIYTAKGNIYLDRQDTVSAMENYRLGIENSTRSGMEKAVALMTLGDLYYERKEYTEAHPCYTEAASILNSEHEEYRRISNLSETLGEFVTAYETVELQDSLQRLSTLSEEEQMAVVEKVIETVKRQEEEEAKRLEDEANKGFVAADRLDMGNALIGSNGEWYFYNPQLKQQGASQFRKVWGNRKLEDNWRRTNKAAPLFASSDTDTGDGETAGIPPADSTSTASGGLALDPEIPQHHQPAYYLNQIPKTAEELAASDALIVEALYKMAAIYDEKLHDYPAAIETYDLCRIRFPNDSRTLEGLYASYRIAGRIELLEAKENYKQQIIDSFPDSKYAAMLSQPDYTAHAQAMLAMQDSLYSATYTAYTKNEHATVARNYRYMAETYPLSDLMPKFAFLNALTIGKADPGAPFRQALTDLATAYPQADVTPMCKDILALMGQGVEAQESNTTSTLSDLRAEQTEAVDTAETKPFNYDLRTAYHLLLVPRSNAKTDFNSLLYDVAAFNFTKFMIKDFDIAHSSVDKLMFIDISQLESADEALWYEQMLLAEPSLQGRITLDKIERIAISDENLGLVRQGSRTMEEYIEWWNSERSAQEEAKAAKSAKKKQNKR